MCNYEKRLQYPVNISRPNAEIAKVIISQFGGPDGEVGAAMRYLSQRYSNTNRKVAGVLTDIGISAGKLRMEVSREIGDYRTPHMNSRYKSPLQYLRMIFFPHPCRLDSKAYASGQGLKPHNKALIPPFSIPADNNLLQYLTVQHFIVLTK